MKTTKYVLAIALGMIALAARTAHATDIITTYTINFTTMSGSPSPVSGSFTYDSTTPQFSNFLVMWDGFTYNLTAAANSPLAPEFGPTGCTGEASNAAFSFLMLSQQLTGCTPTYRWQAENRPASTVGNAVNNFVFLDSTSGGNDEILLPHSLPPGDTPAFAEGSWSLTTKSPVPEPSSIILFVSGLLGLGAAGRRKCLASLGIFHPEEQRAWTNLGM